MANYRYLAHALIGGQFLAELPLGDVEWGQSLNDAGEFSATLDLEQVAANGTSLAADLASASAPRRTALWIERDDVLVWGGIIWNRRARASSSVVDLAGLEFGSILERRKLTETLSYTAVDQLTVAQDLVNWAQSQSGGNIGIIVGTETSGVTITREPLAYGYEYRNLADLLAELAEGDNGFDWSIDVAYSALGEPEATFRLHYPRRGRRALESNLVFFNATPTGGNLIDWDLDESGLDAATTVWGLGAGEGETMVQAAASRTELLDVGYPLTEAVISHKAITDGATLVGLAVEEVRHRSADSYTWTIQVDPDDISVPFGSWTVGDDARIVIDDHPLFPSNGTDPGLETVLRITGQTVRVSDEGGPDEVTLTMGVARG